MSSAPAKQEATEDEYWEHTNQDLKQKNTAERHKQHDGFEATEETDKAQPTSSSLLDHKNEVIASFQQQQGFRDEKRAIVGMLLEEQQLASTSQKRQHFANQSQSSRSLRSRDATPTFPSPPPQQRSTSLLPLRSSSSKNMTSGRSTSNATASEGVRLIEEQEGGLPHPSHAPGAYRMNTPARGRTHPSYSARMMTSSSSLRSDNDERRNTPTTEQDNAHGNHGTGASISAVVVRAEEGSLQQQVNAEVAADYHSVGMEAPAPVEAGGSNLKRRRNIIVVALVISVLLIGGGVAGLVLGLASGNNDSNATTETPPAEERCGLHPQDLLVNCDVYNGGAQALIPECAEAAYESLPFATSNANQTSSSSATSTSCHASELARVSLALHLANSATSEHMTGSARSMFLALAILYYSTDGPNWVRQQSWFVEDMSPCSWFGITCDPSGTDVVQIGLERNNLVGSLPIELGSLTKLSELQLVGGATVCTLHMSYPHSISCCMQRP